MVIVGTNLQQSSEVRSRQGFDNRLSKTVVLNTDNRLIFKKDSTRTQILAATVPGRSLSWDVYQNSFYVPKDDQMMYDENTHQWKDTSGLDDWARIARVLHRAEAEDKKYAAERKAKDDAERLGQDVDTVQLNTAIEAIELEYFGGRAADKTKIYPKKSPMLSGLVFKTTTQVLVIPMTGQNNSPDFSAAKTAYIELSNQKAKQLQQIMNDPQYNDPELDYLEVIYKYHGKDADEAGRDAQFLPVSKDTALATTYPDEWNREWDTAYGYMVNGEDDAKTAELMALRNMSLSSTISPKDIETCTRKYCTTAKGVLASIDLESDDTKRVAADLIKFGLVDKVPKIKDSLQELVDAMEAEKKAGASAEEVEAMDEDDVRAQAVMQAVADTEGLHTVGEIAEKVDLDAVGGDFEGEM